MSANSSKHESFASRLGFLMLAAACAVGLGNVWRFPFITGKYGGAIFVAVYLVCLLAVLPVMVMEFAMGRASRASLGLSFQRLERPGSSWHKLGWYTLLGSYSLMIFYTTVSGWMLLYCFEMAFGEISHLNAEQIAGFFGGMLGNEGMMILGMTLCVVTCFGIAALGLRRGVERIVKIMMLALFALLFVLVVRVLFLPNAGQGIAYFLMPDLDRFLAANPLEICNAAISQAFFTLGIGIGTMATIGSYYESDRSLTGEAAWVAVLDTVVSVLAGMLIFPACFAYGINPDSGPGLIFITLPNVFNSLPQGRMWGTLFFLFMTFAAFSTVIAVFETIIAYSQDVFKMTRQKACLVHCVIMWLLSLPCALGWSYFADVHPLGPKSSILDLEDFLVSSNILPIGALLITLFCTLHCGWGWDGFIREANTGSRAKMLPYLRVYLRYCLPLLLILLLIGGYLN